MSSPRMDGLRVGVTSMRRSGQLIDALEQRGAVVVHGATLSGDVPCPDEEIEADTLVLLAADPDWIVATTGTGMRLWLEAADRTGLGEDLRACIRRSRCVARGAKAVAGLAAADARPAWVSARETDADVSGWLDDHVIGGDAVGVQLHGGQTHAWRHLARLDVDVLSIVTYRSGRPDDEGPAQDLIRQIVDGDLDVVTFTSPSAARNLFAIAADLGVGEAVVRALRDGTVAVASIGPVTSEALEVCGARVTITPRRYRTGDLLRSLAAWVDAGMPAPASTIGLRLDPQERALHVEGVTVPLGPREYEILATLVRSTGAVFRPEELVQRAWGHEAPDDAAAVRHQVARLRRKLAATPLDIRTVRSVGYRLDPRPRA